MSFDKAASGINGLIIDGMEVLTSPRKNAWTKSIQLQDSSKNIVISDRALHKQQEEVIYVDDEGFVTDSQGDYILCDKGFNVRISQYELEVMKANGQFEADEEPNLDN